MDEPARLDAARSGPCLFVALALLGARWAGLRPPPRRTGDAAVWPDGRHPGDHDQHPGLRAARRARRRCSRTDRLRPQDRSPSAPARRSSWASGRGRRRSSSTARRPKRRSWPPASAPSGALVMYNDFVIVGPAADPAGDRRAASRRSRRCRRSRPPRRRSSAAATTRAPTRWSCSLWEQAGIEPAGAWYQESGTGMGDTLNIANERDAYTITDRGTYLALRDRLDARRPGRGRPGAAQRLPRHRRQPGQRPRHDQRRRRPRPSSTSCSTRRRRR